MNTSHKMHKKVGLVPWICRSVREKQVYGEGEKRSKEPVLVYADISNHFLKANDDLVLRKTNLLI